MTRAQPTLPGSVLIGVVRFEVVTDPDEWVKVEHKLQKVGYYGHTVPLLARIYLNPDQAPEVARLTLWHEVLHALAETVMGKPDWTNLGDEQYSREETVVRAWEHPTLQVLRDNPDLVAYLAA